MEETVIVAARRTPIGKFLGAFVGHTAVDLGVQATKAVIEDVGLGPKDVDEVLMGHVIQAGAGQNPARQVALNSGLDVGVAACTINKVCGSGMKTVMLADQAIRLGDAKVIIAGGMESMTRAPMLLPWGRLGHKFGEAKALDAMMRDGLEDPWEGHPMGITGEVVAEEFGITREQADAFSARSHELAQKATENGNFKDEIVPTPSKDARGREGDLVTQDEGMRPGTTAEGLAKLRTAFKKDGVVTAGNASQLSDGASATVVTSRSHAEEMGWPILAKVVAQSVAGVEPKRIMAAPIPATELLLERAGWTMDDVDLFEHNEAFATASCAVKAHFEVPDDRFNVHGGAVALGHPLGCSGTRVLTTLLHAMGQRQKDKGVATLCLGGGNAVSMAVERV